MRVLLFPLVAFRSVVSVASREGFHDQVAFRLDDVVLSEAGAVCQGLRTRLARRPVRRVQQDHQLRYRAVRRPRSQLPYHIAEQTARKPDLEGDGREAQIPPLKKMRPEHDDPSEPWSRSYGERAVERAEAMPSLLAGTVDRAALGPLVRGPLPGDLPIAFRRQIASAMDE